MTSRSLLERFVGEDSEEAFRGLVESQLGLVYSTALRCLEGDSHAAEDVSQEVFALLARKAKRLVRIDSLEGWLYCQACRRAANWKRAARRRHQREAIAKEMAEDTEMTTLWERIAPELERAMLSLSSNDREVILLRFFQGMEHREVAVQIETTEEAARKRATRALERLRAKLSRRGVAMPAAPLATLLLAQAVNPAPASAVEQVALTPMPAVGACDMSAWFGYAKAAFVGACLSSVTILTAQGLIQREPGRPTTKAASVSLLSERTAEHPWRVNLRPVPEHSSLSRILAALRETLEGPQHAIAHLRRSQLIEAIGEDRMPAFVNLANTTLHSAEKGMILVEVLRNWGAKEPDEVLAYVLEHTIDESIKDLTRKHLLQVTFSSWRWRDASAARSWLRSHWDEPAFQVEMSETTLQRFMGVLVTDALIRQEGISSALTYALSLPDRAAQLQAMRPLVGGEGSHYSSPRHSKEQWQELYAALGEGDADLYAAVADAFWKSWATHEYQDARNTIEALEDPVTQLKAELVIWTMSHRNGERVDEGMGTSRITQVPIEGRQERLKTLMVEAEAAGMDREELVSQVGERLRDEKEALAWIEEHLSSGSADAFLANKVTQVMGFYNDTAASMSPISLKDPCPLRKRSRSQGGEWKWCEGSCANGWCSAPGPFVTIFGRVLSFLIGKRVRYSTYLIFKRMVGKRIAFVLGIVLGTSVVLCWPRKEWQRVPESEALVASEMGEWELYHRARHAETREDRIEALGQFGNLSKESIREVCERAWLECEGEWHTAMRALLIRWAELDGRAAMTWIGEHIEGSPLRYALQDAGKAFAWRSPRAFAEWLEEDEQWPLINGRKLHPEDPEDWLIQVDLHIALDCLAKRRPGRPNGLIRSPGSGLAQHAQNRKDLRAILDAFQESNLIREISLSPTDEERLWKGENRFRGEWSLRKRWREIDSLGYQSLIENEELVMLEADIRPMVAPLREAEDRQEAAEALLEGASKEGRHRWLREIVRAWASVDLNEAGEWLGSLENDQDRWSATAVFAQEAVMIDPQAAFYWVDTITDPDIHRAFEERLFHHWYDKDPKGFDEALARPGWPEERRQALLDLRAVTP